MADPSPDLADPGDNLADPSPASDAWHRLRLVVVGGISSGRFCARLIGAQSGPKSRASVVRHVFPKRALRARADPWVVSGVGPRASCRAVCAHARGDTRIDRGRMSSSQSTSQTRPCRIQMAGARVAVSSKQIHANGWALKRVGHRRAPRASGPGAPTSWLRRKIGCAGARPLGAQARDLQARIDAPRARMGECDIGAATFVVRLERLEGVEARCRLQMVEAVLAAVHARSVVLRRGS